ncbi:uncharacterized protein LOC117109903 [Anneissia japonica]|uniref:uncharacterized protein LOC117109903 n=1 Tax=Anneissia japonica TaxID=1529436 RepID=UPI001425AA95|nr:uncharacterized protein LOC117109903 [Anneissia japonica]
MMMLSSFFPVMTIQECCQEKKDAKKCQPGNVNTQVRVLNEYLNNLYHKYKSENIENQYVSFMAFQRIRRSQPHIKLVQYSSRSTSLCQRHQNMALKLKAIKAFGVVSNTNPDEFINSNDDAEIHKMMDSHKNGPKKNESIHFEEWGGARPQTRPLLDSPTAQYRNKTIYSVVSEHYQMFGVWATWNYFEAGHGKGPCDGIGGTVKRLADDAVKRGATVIQDSYDFYTWSSQEHETGNITYCWISKDDCALNV